MRKHLQSLFTFGFWKIHVGNKSNTVWLVTVTIAHRCSWKNNKRMDLWFFSLLHFSPLLPFFSCCFFYLSPFFCLLFSPLSLPFWINNKLVATKISGFSWQMDLGMYKNLMLHFVFWPHIGKDTAVFKLHS